ncbi:pentatricopeptide repeat protein [Artemisia annua]|uniref:Pentatricopeptide repeat protein n=1 Tax=Artemisia annua TaxID=35608 RepID=A0A2U1LJA5_ARTAN|nr:pentatricopeptide repeat protein [Artemisia annua]
MNTASKSQYLTKTLINQFITKHPFSSYTKKPPSKHPPINPSHLNHLISHLPPRFTPDDLHNLISTQTDPLISLHLFNHASKHPRFTHSVSTYHVTLKKLGLSKMYPEFDTLVDKILNIRAFGSECLFNTIIYYYTEARMLSKAVNVYKHMRDLGSVRAECRPSIRTFNLLFTAFLSKRSDSYVNYVYMDTMSMLFRQMVDDGIEPDVFALNCMIKGYVLSLHVNDALRLYHQMGVVYECVPNSFTFDYLIHGLCAQGRTCNARKICGEMKRRGFVPSSKSYSSLVCALVIEGEVDEGVRWLWEMVECGRVGDYVMYWTVVDELCRQKRCEDAVRLIRELEEKRVLDRGVYRKLECELRVKYGKLFDRYGSASSCS